VSLRSLGEKHAGKIDNALPTCDRRAMSPPKQNDHARKIPTPFLEQMHALFAPDDIWAAGRRLGVISRDRKIDLPALVEGTVLALSGLPGAQTNAFANYLQLAGHELAPSAFYDRFTGPFGTLMGDLARRAVAAVRAVAPGSTREAGFARLLERFDDIRVTDSTCLVLQKLAAAWAPSTSKERPAGFKIHSVISAVDMLPVEHHLSPQRTHDNPQLDESALDPGTLYLADLGYVDDQRLMRFLLRGVHVLMRLKLSQNPIIRRVAVGAGDRAACRGQRLDEAFAAGLLDFKAGVVDLDVELEATVDGQLERRVIRIVGLQDRAGGPYGDCWFYLTTVPREVLEADQVAFVYTVRWEIELLWKHLKTGTGLSALRAWRQEAVLALVHAKIIALCLARLLELSLDAQMRTHAYGQLAIVLTLTRMAPTLLAARMLARGVTLQEMERRLLMTASISARSRNQRREGRKRAKLAALRREP
jgi:hypothetical protein